MLGRRRPSPAKTAARQLNPSNRFIGSPKHKSKMVEVGTADSSILHKLECTIQTLSRAMLEQNQRLDEMQSSIERKRGSDIGLRGLSSGEDTPNKKRKKDIAVTYR
jgi:hypothetical protein